MNRRVPIALAVVAGLCLLAVLIWRAVTPRPADADLLSGYIEGQALYVSAPIAGTVTSISVVEGQRVEPGAALFAIDAKILATQLEQAHAALIQARAQAEGARDSQDQQAAALTQTEAQTANAIRDANRFDALAAAKPGAVSVQDVDKARTAAAGAKAQRDAAADQLRNAADQARAARAALAHAEAVVSEAQARLDQLAPRAPARGRIDEVYDQTGEWASANQPIVSLIPDDHVKVRFYVPAGDVSLYHFGQRVMFSCDGCKAGLSAAVFYVSPQPEYTPPIIYSRKARDKLVFMIEARPDNPRDLTPGLPVDVIPLGRQGKPAR